MVRSYKQEAPVLMNSLEAVDWTPLAVVAIAGGMDWSAVENGWWQGEYLMTPTPWTQDNPVVRDSWSANPRMPACGRTSTQCNNWAAIACYYNTRGHGLLDSVCGVSVSLRWATSLT